MFIFSPKLIITHGSRVESNSVIPPCFSFSFFPWFCHLYLFLYPRLPVFLCSVAFLTVNIFLIPISSLIYGSFLFRNSSILSPLLLFWAFQKINGIGCPPPRKRNFFPPCNPLQLRTSHFISLIHAIPLLSCIAQQGVYTPLLNDSSNFWFSH